MIFPNPKAVKRLALDTETTGVGHEDVPVGMGFSLDQGQVAGYASWGHQGGSNNTTKQNVIDWLRDLNPGTIVYFHSALYDIRMLANAGVDLVDRGLIVRDTQYMAAVNNELEPSFTLGGLISRKLGLEGKNDEALNQYCADTFGGPATRKKQIPNYWRAPAHIVEPYGRDDAVLTEKLADYYEANIRDRDLEVLGVEWRLIPIMWKMYRAGVPVDVARAEEHYDRITKEIAVLQREWDKLTGGIPMSGKGSKKLLMKAWAEAGLPFGRTKPSKKYPNGQRSLNKDVLESVSGHPLADTLKAFREREKISGTFLKGYIIDGHHSGRVHPTFHPLKTDDYGAVSGRFSSSDPNFQNLPSPDRDDKSRPVDEQWGRMIRTLILPENGRDWAKIDYSQIEYRFFAHYAGGRMREAYNEDAEIDFHSWCAEIVYGEGFTKEHRSKAKNGNFAKLYGAGPRRLARTLGVSTAEAKLFMVEYDQKIPEAAKLYNKAMRTADRHGYIRTWGGRKRRFRRKRGGFESTYAALNALLQGSSADLIKKAMIALDEGGVVDWKETVMHLTVHDELDFSIPRGEKGLSFLRDARDAMIDFPSISVPLKADPEVGPTWGDVQEIEV